MSDLRTRRAPICGLAVLVFIGGGIASFSAGAATQTHNASAQTSSGPPGADWIAPGNILGAPDVNCAATSDVPSDSWIQVSFPSFGDLAGGIVTGIEVRVKYHTNGSNLAQLTVGGSLVGATRVLPLQFAGPSNCNSTAFVNAGADGDFWGISATDLANAAAAGTLGFRITQDNGPTLDIDAVELIVYFTPAGNSPPTASCQDVTVSADASCQGSVTAAQVDDGSSDPDGDSLTLSLDSTGPFALGDASVTLTVSDGVASDSCTATVTVEDNTAPVVSLNAGDLSLECALEAFTDPGATATDNCDDPVLVSVGGDSVDEGTPGSYVITYDAVDSAGNNAAQATRTVIVEDTTPPEITLNGENPITLECAVDLYVEPGAAATDACDDPDPGLVVGGDEVDAAVPGTYIVTYDAVDTAGNAADQASRTVTVEDTLPPEIACNAPDPATIIPPDAPISFTATAVDACEGVAPAVIDGYDCYWTNPAGKLVDKTNSCIVSFAGDTLNVEDSGGVKDTISWSVTAADSVPNQSSAACGVLVVKPSGKKKP